MKHTAGQDGATEPVSATTPPDAESDGLAQRRLVYAERCENLIQALQFVNAVLRKTPAGGNDTRNATARDLAERLPPEELEAAFQRIDAMWAAWTRPDTGSARNRESVGRHARMALLAAVDQAAQFVHLSKVTRALARRRAGYALSAEEEVLIQSRTEAAVAEGLLDGKPHLVRTLSGDLEYEREAVTAETAADAELPQPPELVRRLTRHNGYPDLASKLTDEQADRLVRAWSKRAGRPRGGEVANWKVILDILADLDLGKSANVRKDWEAFRRENGTARPPP